MNSELRTVGEIQLPDLLESATTLQEALDRYGIPTPETIKKSRDCTLVTVGGADQEVRSVILHKPFILQSREKLTPYCSRLDTYWEHIASTLSGICIEYIPLLGYTNSQDDEFLDLGIQPVMFKAIRGYSSGLVPYGEGASRTLFVSTPPIIAQSSDGGVFHGWVDYQRYNSNELASGVSCVCLSESRRRLNVNEDVSAPLIELFDFSVRANLRQ